MATSTTLAHARSLDDKLQLLLNHIDQVYKVFNRVEQVRIEAWSRKLKEKCRLVSWKKNRNLYAWLLMQQVEQGKLESPFDKVPGDGPLPNMPSSLKMLVLNDKRRLDSDIPVVVVQRPKEQTTSAVAASPSRSSLAPPAPVHGSDGGKSPLRDEAPRDRMISPKRDRQVSPARSHSIRQPPPRVPSSVVHGSSVQRSGSVASVAESQPIHTHMEWKRRGPKSATTSVADSIDLSTVQSVQAGLRSISNVFGHPAAEGIEHEIVSADPEQEHRRLYETINTISVEVDRWKTQYYEEQQKSLRLNTLLAAAQQTIERQTSTIQKLEARVQSLNNMYLEQLHSKPAAGAADTSMTSSWKTPERRSPQKRATRSAVTSPAAPRSTSKSSARQLYMGIHSPSEPIRRLREAVNGVRRVTDFAPLSASQSVTASPSRRSYNDFTHSRHTTTTDFGGAGTGNSHFNATSRDDFGSDDDGGNVDNSVLIEADLKDASFMAMLDQFQQQTNKLRTDLARRQHS